MKIKTNQLVLLLILWAITLKSQAQVGINKDNPDSCAIFQVSDEKRGVIFPQIDFDANFGDTSKLSDGLLYYNTNQHKFKYYSKNKKWQCINPWNATDTANISTNGSVTIRDTLRVNTKIAIGTTTITSTTVNATTVNAINGNGIIPIGGIIMWSGATTPPSGWSLCDGTNGTPDLRGKFIVGYSTADADYNSIGKTGGEKLHQLVKSEIPQHVHTISSDTHSHTTSLYYRQFDFGGTGGSYMNTGPQSMPDSQSLSSSSYTHDHGGSTGSGTGLTDDGNGKADGHENRPPYYVLAYIMRIK
jgi:microcystin-dependent protein